MTNKELIALLQQLPPDHQVVVDLHSEWCIAAAPKLVEGFDNGGYISEPRYANNIGAAHRVHGYIHIGYSHGDES